MSGAVSQNSQSVMAEQPFDLVLRGNVLDPTADTVRPGEIGIRDGHIAAVADSLAQTPRAETLDLGAAYLSPGFVDIHAHIYVGVTSWGIHPDPACLRSGVTTVVDAGSAGWTMLQGFRWFIQEPSRVRVLCFLHISGLGLVNGYVGESRQLGHMHPRTVGEHAAENRDLVVGIKVRQGGAQVGRNGTRPLRLALEAAEIASKPVMCHIGRGVPLRDVLSLLRPGDIVTHCFQGKGAEGEKLTDADGTIRPEAHEARARGVVMDVGHGGGSFRWEVAEAALQQGYVPDVISTDLHAYNLHGPLYDMATTLTKFLYLGLPLREVVRLATTAPAAAIGRPDLGTLAIGAPADIAAFHIVNEPVALVDTHHHVRHWDRRLKVLATIRAGKLYRPEELVTDTPEEITRRCRIRAPGKL